METTMKIEYRRQGESSIGAWQPLTNLDELIWDGVYALRMSGDDNTSGLPFRVDDNDSMTFVVKDHAHDGSLQNNRTIVQTITRVEHSTGKVFVYNRTRYYSNGSHSWNSWELACDENGHPTFDNNTVQQVEKNKNDIANEIIRAKSMDEGLDARVTANTTAISNEINRAQNVEQNIKNSLRSTTPRVHIGALQENSDPYPGTSYSAYSDPVTGNGEIVVSDKYIIDTIKMFAKDGTPWGYTDNYNGESFTIDDNFDYQLGFRRKDNGKFTSDELKRVVQSFIIDTIVWGTGKDLNNYRCAGEYSIEGKRENTADNMPIYNIGNINARLTVLNAGGCVTQVLTLLNIGGGDSNIYTRTMQNGTWNMWNKLQSNVEVGAIGLGQTRTFDHLTDNGMYSGYNVYQTGTDDNGNPIIVYETFVLVVINGYLTGGGISQLKYSLLQNGITTVATREKTGEAWSEWNDVADVKNGAVTAEKLSADVREKVNNPLRPLYIAAGAEYNESTGNYELNGIADLTESDMMYIYEHKNYHFSLNTARYFQENKNVRTIFPMNTVNTVYDQLFKNNKLSLVCTLMNSNFEVIKFSKSQTLEQTKGIPTESGSMSCMFTNAKKLKTVYPIDVSAVTSIGTSFEGTIALINVRLCGLKCSAIFKDSTNISKESVLYMMQYALPTSAIAITLHPDAYARLADDADIVAALEAQPLVSLVSA